MIFRDWAALVLFATVFSTTALAAADAPVALYRPELPGQLTFDCDDSSVTGFSSGAYFSGTLFSGDSSGAYDASKSKIILKRQADLQVHGAFGGWHPVPVYTGDAVVAGLYGNELTVHLSATTTTSAGDFQNETPNAAMSLELRHAGQLIFTGGAQSYLAPGAKLLSFQTLNIGNINVENFAQAKGVSIYDYVGFGGNPLKLSNDDAAKRLQEVLTQLGSPNGVMTSFNISCKLDASALVAKSTKK